MDRSIQSVIANIASFRRKYYLNLAIRGALLSLTILLLYFLLAALVEHVLWLSSGTRLVLFTSFFLVAAFCVLRFLREPLAFWLANRGMDEQQSARLIGQHFTSVGDRLLNVLQLSSVGEETLLAQAGIAQKAQQFEHVAFAQAVDLRGNLRYLRILVLPFVMLLILLLVNRQVITDSAQRIVQFNQQFSPQAPFQFVVQNTTLRAYYQEDFTLTVTTEGEALPEAVYIVRDNQRWKMETTRVGVFRHTFEKVQTEMTFQLEGSGFFSAPYTLQLINRPELLRQTIQLTFPRYLNQKNSIVNNAGNLEVPEGTVITWKINTAFADRAHIEFASSPGTLNAMPQPNAQSFQFGKEFRQPDTYTLHLENEESKNKDRITYPISVIKDQHPQITLEHLRDSVLFKSVYLAGNASDDHGLTGLQLHYEVVRKGRANAGRPISIAIQKSAQQNFFYAWSLDSLRLAPGDQVNYYVQVWDNDGVNGRKSARTASYVLNIPSEEELRADIVRAQNQTENTIDQSLQRARQLQDAMEEARQKLKGKQNLTWQDKKMLEDLIRQREKLNESIAELQKENKALEEKRAAFQDENERIREKSQKIQELMDQLLDEETKKLFEEMEKLLRENSDPSQLQKMLDKMNRKEINLEKELERTLELFKQLQYDHKLDQAIQSLQKQTEAQKELLEKTKEAAGEKTSKNNEDKTGPEKSQQTSPDKKPESDKGQADQKPTTQELANEQDQSKKDFEAFKEQLNDLQKLGQELGEQTPNIEEQEKQAVEDAQEQSRENLEQNKPGKAKEQQQKSIQKMEQMQAQLSAMQNSMEMEMNTENMESLRQILHGLIKLSFDQEALMKDFAGVQQADPKYVGLSQQQLKIKEDAKVLEDSLLALAKRDPFMGSIVTKEVGELNEHIDKAVEQIKERRRSNASTEMQFSMTSINNLALMLNDHFDMMMNMMANAKPGKGKKQQGKQPSLSQLQMQLNEQMEQLKNGGKAGRELSEELARMAAEQERIRRALQEMEQKLKEQGGTMPGDLPGKMEQTEMDLVNKQLTEQTLRRQQEIVTRLLEAEKSMREQDMDDERKGETAKDYDKEIPRAFQEYLRLKEKEVELLKTVPPKLYPYYKKEVNKYFERIGNE